MINTCHMFVRECLWVMYMYIYTCMYMYMRALLAQIKCTQATVVYAVVGNRGSHCHCTCAI
jgi:hypothetical protein